MLNFIRQLIDIVRLPQFFKYGVVRINHFYFVDLNPPYSKIKYTKDLPFGSTKKLNSACSLFHSNNLYVKKILKCKMYGPTKFSPVFPTGVSDTTDSLAPFHRNSPFEYRYDLGCYFPTLFDLFSQPRMVARRNI